MDVTIKCNGCGEMLTFGQMTKQSIKQSAKQAMNWKVMLGLKKIEWLPKHQKSFEDYKKVVATEVMLAYPDFLKDFEIFTDSSSRQLGSVITQDGKPLAFYSNKLTKCQMNYTITDLELLSIVMKLSLLFTELFTILPEINFVSFSFCKKILF